MNELKRLYMLQICDSLFPIGAFTLSNGVETGGCPHTAIREDCSMNLEAVDEMAERFPDVQIIFIESGGDNLSATFSPDLADASIYVIDVAQGEKIPRKGGPGVTRSDLLVINKIDLAPLVGASLEVMASDSARMREGRKFLFTNLVSGEGLDDVISWIKSDVLFEGKRWKAAFLCRQRGRTAAHRSRICTLPRRTRSCGRCTATDIPT